MRGLMKLVSSPSESVVAQAVVVIRSAFSGVSVSFVCIVTESHSDIPLATCFRRQLLQNNPTLHGGVVKHLVSRQSS